MTTNARDEKWSEWIDWSGGKCPISNGTKYQVRFRLGNECGVQESPQNLYWEHHNSDGDIIAYRYKIKEPESMEVTDAEEEAWQAKERSLYGEIKEGFDALEASRSDGSTASYYELPPGCTELQDLISYRNLNAQDGEMFRAIYRKGLASHSDELRDARKVLFYAKAEVERLERKCIG